MCHDWSDGSLSCCSARRSPFITKEAESDQSADDRQRSKADPRCRSERLNMKRFPRAGGRTVPAFCPRTGDQREAYRGRRWRLPEPGAALRSPSRRLLVQLPYKRRGRLLTSGTSLLMRFSYYFKTYLETRGSIYVLFLFIFSILWI